MKLFLKILGTLCVFLIIFSFYITRVGKIFTPEGEGEITIDAGTFEAFPLPQYAQKMIDENYKSYFIEVEPGL